MTDTQPRRGPGDANWGPPPGGYPPAPAPWAPQNPHAPVTSGAYPPPSGPPPPRKKPKSVLRMLAIVAAVVFGIPVALGVATVAYTVFHDNPASNSPSAADATPTTVSIPGPAGGVVATSTAPAPDPFGPLDLKPGGCYNSVPLPPDGSTVRIASVEAVPCSEPHTGQVVATFAYPKNTSNEATQSRLDKDCGQSFTNRLTKKVRNDNHYRPGYIHSDSTQLLLSSVRAACVVVTDGPTTGSALKA